MIVITIGGASIKVMMTSFNSQSDRIILNSFRIKYQQRDSAKKKKVPIKRKFLPSPALQGHQAKQNM